MRRLCFVSLLWAILLVISGCRTAINPERPAESYSEFRYEPKISVINLPVEMKISDLETYLNRQLSGLIYEDNSLDDNGGDNLMVKAWKKDNIRLRFDKGAFYYQVPLKLWIKAGWKIEKFGISLSDYREVNAEIALDFHSTMSINKDWTLSTKTISDGYQWISKPVLKIGPVDLPITFIANLIIKYNMETISEAIDEGLKSSLDLRTVAQDAWEEIQKPILLDEEYQLWLRIIPKSVSAIPLSVKKGVLSHNSSIQAIAECFSGLKPPHTVNPILPDLKTTNALNDNFQVNVTSYVSYHYIDSLSTVMLVNTSYPVGKRNLTITGVHIYANEGKMIVETDVTGSLNGKIYFSGKPVYRASDSTLIINELDFHLKTKNLLVKSASWLLNGGVERILEKKMVYPVGQNLRETYNMISQSLDHYSLDGSFFITGQLTRMEVAQPVLASDAIIAPLVFEGKVRIGLENR